MSDTDKKLELLRKLKQLSERGVGGEAENAQKMYERFMEKNGLTEADLEFLEQNFEFDVEKEFEILFDQFLSSEFYPKPDIKVYEYKKTVSRKIKRFILCAVDKGIYLQCRWELLKRSYKDQHALFYHAFVHKNDLYSINPNPSPPTPEDIEKSKKAKRLAMGLDKVQTQKQIQ